MKFAHQTKILSAAIVGLTLVGSVFTIPMNAQAATPNHSEKTNIKSRVDHSNRLALKSSTKTKVKKAKIKSKTHKGTHVKTHHKK